MQGCLYAAERYFLLKVCCCILINNKYKGMWFTFILQRQPIWISVNPRRWGFKEENDWDWFTCCVSHAVEMPIRWRVVLPLLKYRRRHRSYLKYLLRTDMHCVTCLSVKISSLIHIQFEGDMYRITIIMKIIILIIKCSRWTGEVCVRGERWVTYLRGQGSGCRGLWDGWGKRRRFAVNLSC